VEHSFVPSLAPPKPKRVAFFWREAMPAASEALSTDLRPRSEALSTAMVPRSEAREVGTFCTFFPFHLRCCPCLPTSWTKVQDWLHLVLITGVLASVACVVQMIYELAWGDSCKSPFCFKQIISGVCVLPSTIYFIKTIGTYDEQLREKKERHRTEVEKLIEVINIQVVEMNDLCRKVTENANEFATGRFNDKCEQFQRFLQGVGLHYQKLYTTEEMLQELRHFVLQWMRVFSGSLLSPQASPLLRGAEDELQRCHTAEEVCNAALRRIKESRVVFQFQMPAESPLLTGQSVRATGASFNSGSSIHSNYADIEANSFARCGVTWFEFGRCRRFDRRRSPSADGMPVRIEACCCSVRVLSRQHANLLFAFALDIFLVVFEVLSLRWTSFVLVAINEMCIISMLACFEQINEIAQLERQIHVYEQRKEEVEQRTVEAKGNWEKVQQLHDLWLYRTLPSLAIMGKIHNHLTDEDMSMQRDVANGIQAEDKRLGFLRLANESLECLEQKLGPLEDWSGPERLDERWKQSIGQQLKACEGNTDLGQLLAKLPIITSDLSMLEAAPPSSASEDLSLRPTPRESPIGSPRSSHSAASSSFPGAAAPNASSSNERQRWGTWRRNG